MTRLTQGQIADTIVGAGLFHKTFYERQRSHRFASPRDALADYLDEGVRGSLSPHPLFSTPFYLRGNAEVRQSGIDPVMHYLLAGWREHRDPHPLFDSRWYVAQIGALGGLNPLSHYLRHAARDRRSPNRLFDTRLYLEEHEDTARAGINPLEHYVLYGRDEGRVSDRRIHPLVAAWRGAEVSLKRGAWKRPQTIWLAVPHAERYDETLALVAIARELVDRCRVDVRVVLDHGGPLRSEFEQSARTVCLEDYAAQTEPGSDFQPSTLRMLLFSLLGDEREVTLWNASACPPLAEAFTDLGVTVANVNDISAMGAPLRLMRSGYRGPSPRRVIVPCMDWSISGVHMVAETLGKELIARGWDFRLLFTRGTIGVLDHMSTAALPAVPYEFLDVSLCHTVRDHCAALIRYFERHAPCVLLSTFDDLANAVAPALTDQVGVVGWLQSDEPHYYESAYRLGRYWNNLACVSSTIAAKVCELNPALAGAIRLIHNSTVPRAQIARDREFLEHGRLRLVYVGRLVQHQKRVLDFMALIDALEREQVPYRFTLIGTSPAEETEQTLKRHLAEQLATGKVRFTGRLDRSEVLRELAHHDAFILLSDFEGLPVSMIEAMASGCVPVVTPVESGIPEVVRHDENGLIIHGRDYAVWAAALDQLRRDEARLIRLSEAARRTVLGELCSERMADQFEAVFSGILQDIQHRRYSRPHALTWQNRFDDVLLPPSMQGTIVD